MTSIPKQIGPYEVESELGRGGMGVVYLGHDTRLDRKVAIKSLPEHFAADPDRLARFEREARTLATLNHPNVAGIYGVEEHDGRRYLILEFVEGESLAERLDRGPLAIDDAIEICAQVAAGVEAAHEAGVIHRDLKPDNIRITPEGKAKVLDFGLARSDEAASSGSVVSQTATLTTPLSPHTPTMPGAVLGTAPYMSPEQARGRRVDKRSDIWSLGVVLYECLTGSSPFAGETATDSIGAILHKDVDFDQLPENVPARIRDLLRRMLQRDKSNRMRDAGDVWIELEAARDAVSEEAIHSGAGRRRSPAFWAACAAALAAASTGAWALRGELGPTPRLTKSPKFMQVTDRGGVEEHVRLSPDGQSVVYVARGPQGLDIFSQRVGGFNAVNLTEDSPGFDGQPAFSPDGARIAFASERAGGGIWLMGATGESPRRLTQFGYWPSWSPDGQSIVFTTEFMASPYARTSVASLWTVSASGGEPTQIYAGDAVQPSWSPGGERIAFWALADGGNRDVLTIPAGGGDAVPITRDSATDWSPTWSPDGRYLYFCSDRGGAMNIWRTAIDASTGETIGDIEAVTAGTGEISWLSSAHNALRLAFSTYSVGANIERIGFDAESGAVIGQPEAVTTGSSPIMWMHLSPDGSQLAATIDHGSEDLVVLSADGKSRRLLTNDPAKDRIPSWSADGEWIFFLSDRSGLYQMWIMRPDGSDLREVTAGYSSGRIGSGAILPGGGLRLAYVEEQFEILDLDEQGNVIDRQSVELPEVKDLFLQPGSFSPDGSLAVLNRFSNLQKGGLVIVEPMTGRVVSSIDGYGVATWIDTARLALVSGGRLDLYDLASGESTTILDISPDTFGLSLSFDAASGLLYYGRVESEADIWVADLPEE